MKNNLKISLSLVILVMSAGCSAMNSEPPGDRISNVKGDQSVPDVSIQHCIDDGYKVVKVTKDGIPVRYLCVDPSTGHKCETWAYYRGDCRPADSGKQSGPSSGITIKSK